MFRKFFEFVGESTKQDIRSVDEFLEYCSGKSFLNGLYRIHDTADIPKWNDIAGRVFPEFAGIIKVFGYDWLGRHLSGHYELLHSQCAGYKVPLFLNGQDTLDNLEVSDMEVYWEIMAPLINL